MQMQGERGAEAVEIFGWSIWRIRLRQASKVVRKDSGKQMLLRWPPMSRWEGRRVTGEYFEVSSQVGPKGRLGLVNLL